MINRTYLFQISLSEFYPNSLSGRFDLIVQLVNFHSHIGNLSYKVKDTVFDVLSIYGTICSPACKGLDFRVEMSLSDQWPKSLKLEVNLAAVSDIFQSCFSSAPRRDSHNTWAGFLSF